MFVCFNVVVVSSSKSNSRNPDLKITKKCNLLHQAWQKQILDKDQCAVSLHSYSFSDASSALCWVGRRRGGRTPWGWRARAQEPGTSWAGRRGELAGQAHALAGRQLPGPTVKSRFPWSPSLLVPSPGSGRRSKQPWETVSIRDPEVILLPWGDISFCSSLPFPIIT